MNELINHINNLLTWAKQTPDHATAFFHQAFGAVQFYMIEHDLRGTEYAELETLWNETYKPAFEFVMYGGYGV